jgi:hypothetical protein
VPVPGLVQTKPLLQFVGLIGFAGPERQFTDVHQQGANKYLFQR